MKSKLMRMFALIVTIATFSSMVVGCGGNGDSSSKASDTASSPNSEVSTLEGNSEGEASANESDAPTESDSTANDSKNNTSKDNTGNGTSIGTSSGQQSGSKTFTEPVYDLKGRTIKIVTEQDYTDRTKDTVFNKSIKATEKKFNCKIVFVKNTDYVGIVKQLKSDSQSGKATYDAAIFRGYDIEPYLANTGYILKLDEYYDFKNDPTWQVEQVKDLGWFKGHRYGIPYSPNEYGYGIWYNKDMLSKAGIPDLWTYVNDGNWTWDTFRKVCKTFMLKQGDTNNDGKRDNYAFTSTDPWLDFISTNNASLLKFDKNGKPSIALDSENAIEALQFIADLHNVDHSVPNGEELKNLGTDSPFGAMFTGKVAMYSCHARYGRALQDMKIKNIGWVYYPKGPKASDYVVPSGTQPDMAVVPAKVSNPKEIVAVVQDALAYWDTSREEKIAFSAKSEELFNAIKSTLDNNSAKLFQQQAKKPVYTMANSYNLELLQSTVWPDILANKGTVKSIVAKYKNQLNSKVNELYSGKVVS